MKPVGKTICKVTIVIVCMGLAFTVYCNWSLKRNGQQGYAPDDMEDIPETDYGIVPGCLVYKNGKPSYALEDRLNTALKLFREHKIKQFILSGAARENEAGKQFLMEQGMEEELILIDDGGLDTYSTIYRCRDAFQGKTFLVCTQEKYFKRTGYLINQLGMKGYCVKADIHSYKKELYERFRDFFASVKAWGECNLTKPEPKYSLEELLIIREETAKDEIK